MLFTYFDEATGAIQEDYLRQLLAAMETGLQGEESEELYREAPIDKKGASIILLSCTSLSMEQKAKMTENFRFQSTSFAALSTSATFSQSLLNALSFTAPPFLLCYFQPFGEHSSL